MSDVSSFVANDVRVSPREWIDAEVNRLSLQLSGLLRERFADNLGPVADAVRFLDDRGAAIVQPPNVRVRCPASPGPLANLIEAFSLDDLEMDLLLFAGMADHHEGFADVFRMLHPMREPYPTAGLAAQLLCVDEDARLELRQILGSGALLRAGALRCVDSAPLFARSVSVPSAVWTMLQGGHAHLDRLPRAEGEPVAPGLGEWLASRECQWAISALADARPCDVVIVADDSEVAWFRGLALVEQSGLRPLPLKIGDTKDPGVLNAIRLHCAMMDEVPVIRYDQSVPSDLWASLADLRLPTVLCGVFGRVPQVPLRPSINIQASRLSVTATRTMWAALLPELEDSSDTLAAVYPVEPYQAARIERDSRFRTNGAVDLDVVAASFRNLTASGVSGSIDIVRPVSSWAQLVLPDAQLQQLRDAERRLFSQSVVLDDWGFLAERRGARGVRMLFSGPPGTGKTLSAEVLANALDVDLLIVDLSRVVSKWIGETEKNLAAVFNEAERTKTVLFFDEADALFGKRTEVSDAHDRYANLETAYLLSRLERFEGLTILATNFRRNIDSAFVRRLDYIVEFREPSVDERERLWQCHIPENAPIADDVDLAEVARLFPIVGGQIRNAALSAAYFAAHEQTAICRDHLIQGIRREYDKAGKAFRELAIN